MLVTVAFMVTLGIFIVVSVAVQVSLSLTESYLMSVINSVYVKD